MVREYIGARYVPKFMGLFDITQDYEALSVVDNGQGTSYISKIPTPAGTPLTDGVYWTVYGSTNGAIINLQDQIYELRDGAVIDCENPPTSLSPLIPDEDFDNTARLQALIDYCSSNDKILVLHGNYAVSGTVIIRSNTSLLGTGLDASNRDSQQPFTESSAIIRRMGSNTDPVLETDPLKRVSGVNINNIGVYGNSVTNYGIRIYRMVNSVLNEISISDVAGTALYLKPNGDSIGDDNIMGNSFTAIFIDRCYDGLYVGENDHGNCYNNYFRLIRCDYYHIAGIFVGGDNNVFEELTCYGRGNNTDAYAWHLDGARFVSNTFYHIAGKLKAVNGSYNAIYEYDRENGEPAPYVDSTSKLYYTSNSRNGSGTNNVHVTKNITIPLSSCEGLTPALNAVNDKWVLLQNTATGMHVGIGLDGNTRRMVIAHSWNGGAAVNVLEVSSDSIFLRGRRITSANVGAFSDGDILLTDAGSLSVGGYVGRVYFNGGWHNFGKIE